MEDVINAFQKSILEEVNKQRSELNKLSELIHQNIEDNANIPNAAAADVTLADINRSVSALVEEKNCLSRKYAFLDTQYRGLIKENALLEAQNAKTDAMLKGYLIKYQPVVPLVPIQPSGPMASQSSHQNRDLVEYTSDSDTDDNGHNDQVATTTQASHLHQSSHRGPNENRDSASWQEPPQSAVQIIEVSDADTQLYVCSELNCNEIFTRKSRFDYHMKGHAGAHGKSDQASRAKPRTMVLAKRKPLKGMKITPAAEKRTKKVRKQSKTGTNSASIAGNEKRNRIVPGETVDEKKFTCIIAGCGKQFATKLVLHQHVQRHPENARFFCGHNGCEKKFGFKTDFERHVRIHSGEKPFICPVVGCAQKFALKGNLSMHMKKLH